MRDPARRLPDDPKLSEEANRVLAEELQEATGERIERIPPEPGDHATAQRPASPFLAALAAGRLPIAIAFAVALVFGAILSLVTGSWWLLGAASLAHALGTFLVAGVAVQASTQVERPSPEVAARLEEEGVADPERALNDRLEALEGEEARSRTARVVGPGDPELSYEPAAQQTALTPSSEPASPVGNRAGPISLMPWAVVVALLVISLLAPLAFDGGELWVVPLVVWPSVAVFAAIDRAYR